MSLSQGVLQGLDDSSITVNGVTYERHEAAVVDGFGKPMQGDVLRLGMWVEVRGTYDEADRRGVAQILTVKPAARGTVTDLDPSGLSVTVLGTKVRLSSGEVREGFADAEDIRLGAIVEVHGALDPAGGEVTASRVAVLSADQSSSAPFELRGRVKLLDTKASTATIGNRTVSFANATLTLRSVLANGQVVRVSSLSPPVAGQTWSVDQLSSDQPLPSNAGFVYVEGFVEAFGAGPLFELDEMPVDARAADMRSLVTADGQRIAVVGSLVKGTLKAKAVALIQPGAPVVFTLAGSVTMFVSQSDFRVRGVVVDASSAVFEPPASLNGLSNDVRVKVVGTFRDRRLIASKVEFLR